MMISQEQKPTVKATGVAIDRVTQLQDCIDQLVFMLVNSLDYLHKKAGMAQVDSSIPVTQQNTLADDTESFKLKTREVATDICHQTKKIDMLIEALPGIDISTESQREEFMELEKENRLATEELREANKKAKKLLKELSDILRPISDNTNKSACV